MSLARNYLMRVTVGSVLAAWLCVATVVQAAESFEWNKEKNRVSADLSTWSVIELLGGH